MPSTNYCFSYGQLFIALALVMISGCQPRGASKLLGRWEGRPESAVARAAREAEKYGDESQPSSSKSGGSAAKSDDKADQALSVTDWEQYDVSVVMDFVSSDRLEMSLGDGSEKRSGEWQIVVTSPTGCVIEVKTPVADQDNEQEPTLERRRFELILDERDGKCVGFLLTEVGADRQLGSLYFKRPKT